MYRTRQKHMLQYILELQTVLFTPCSSPNTIQKWHCIIHKHVTLYMEIFSIFTALKNGLTEYSLYN